MLEEGRSRCGRAALFACLDTVVVDAGGWLPWLRDAERPRIGGRAAVLARAAAARAVAPRKRRALPLGKVRGTRGGVRSQRVRSQRVRSQRVRSQRVRGRPGPVDPRAEAGVGPRPVPPGSNRAPVAPGQAVTARPANARVPRGRQAAKANGVAPGPPAAKASGVPPGRPAAKASSVPPGPPAAMGRVGPPGRPLRIARGR
jgi:hypothetical protein